MIKKSSFILILCFLLILSACASKSVASTSKAALATPKPTETPQPTPTPAPSPINFDSTAEMKLPGKGVPVLMYHSIKYEKGNAICLPPEKFEEHMKYLKDNGYYTITLNDLYNYLMKNESIPEKALVLTFDDGYEDNYTAMFPILKKYNFNATIFVITSNIDKDPNSMTSKQLLEMQAYGVDIESHTVNHDNLKLLPKAKQLETLVKSKQDLETLLNKKVNFFAYPYGGWNKTAVESVKEAGYTMAFTTDGRWSSKKNGILSLDRVYISSFHDLNVFKERISNPNYKSLAQ